VQHRRVFEDPDTGFEESLVVEALRSSTRPVVRIRWHEEANADAASSGVLDTPNHALVSDVRIHNIKRLASTVEEVANGGRDRPVPTRRVVQDLGGYRIHIDCVCGEEWVQFLGEIAPPSTKLKTNTSWSWDTTAGRRNRSWKRLSSK
jgi:hypothetical protein